MAHYLAVDIQGLQKTLKHMPTLPALLIYLAWGASQMNCREKLERFSKSGLFQEETCNLENQSAPLQIAS